MKILYSICFVLIIFTLSGQTSPKIKIEVKNSKTFNLSEIAEQIQPVGLEITSENQFNHIVDVLWTNTYLFVHAIEIADANPISKVMQFDQSGKFIRIILIIEGEKLRKIFCDSIKKQIFIQYGGDLQCYDFDGKLINTYKIDKFPDLYTDGIFWTSHIQFLKDITSYSLISLNIQTAKEDTLFNFVEKNNFDLIARIASFSLRNNKPVVSFGLDNKIYQVEGKKVVPIVNFTISEPARKEGLDIYGYQFQGFIGNYLCIHFMRKEQYYLYLQNQRTGKEFLTKFTFTSGGINDDMLATGLCKINYLNRSGYFYFVKKREELSDSKLNITDEKQSHFIFFVKLKQ